MRPKLNSKDKGQMSIPNEYTDNFKSKFVTLKTGKKIIMTSKIILLDENNSQIYDFNLMTKTLLFIFGRSYFVRALQNVMKSTRILCLYKNLVFFLNI